MPCLERISLPQEINIHLYFSCSSFQTISFNGFMIQWGKLQKIRTTCPMTWLFAQLNTYFAAILKNVPLGKGQDSVPFCGSPGSCLSFRLRDFSSPRTPRLHFLSQRLPAWVKMISLLLLMGAVGWPSVCTWTTFFPLQASPKNMFRKNKHLELPKTLRNWSKDSNISFLKKKRKEKIIAFVDAR